MSYKISACFVLALGTALLGCASDLIDPSTPAAEDEVVTAEPDESGEPADPGGSPEGDEPAAPQPGSCDTLGAVEDCYGGAPEQAGVGACVLGERTCEDDGELLMWSQCQGWGGATAEVCGDTVDSDCDGEESNGCFACDGVSPVWTDPDLDGSFKLFGNASGAFDAGVNTHSEICVTHQAHVNVCNDTVIELSGGPAIIAGNGIGPSGAFPVQITVNGKESDDVFILVDCTLAPVTIITNLPNADVTVFAIGSHPITFKGTTGDLILGGQDEVSTGAIIANGSVHITSEKNITATGSVTANGNITIGGGLTLAVPSCS